MDSLFFLFFFFFLTMAPQVLEKKIALLFMYRKIVIIFKSVELEHTPSSFPIKKVISDCAISKKKGSSRRIYSCFFTHNGITTPKTTREGQESTTKISLHLAWPPKFKNQVLFTPRAQNRFLDLGLLPRGCRPKSRSLPGRVEVIQPVVRACTTFWLTSTRITLTRVHRSPLILRPFQAQSVSHRTDKTSLKSKRTPRDFPRRLFLYPVPSAAARTAPNGVKERASFCLVFRSLNTTRTSSHRMFSMGYRRAKSTQGNTNFHKRIFLANNFGITTRGPLS